MPPPDQASADGALPPSAIALMLLLAAFWGLNMVAVKGASAGIPPVLQAGLRSVVAARLVPLLCRPLGLGFGVLAGALLLDEALGGGFLAAVALSRLASGW